MRRSTSIVVLLVLLAAGLGAAGTAVARGSSGSGVGTSRPVRLFDANIRYTSGVFLPLPTYTSTSVQPLTTDAWTSAARSASRIAADGVTLILIRAQLALNNTLPVTFLLVPDSTGADPGSLWAIDDPNVVDVSSQGGTIDAEGLPPTALSVTSVVVNGRRYAFLLYRAPRNFDGASTAQLASRSTSLVMLGLSSAQSVTVATLTIVRPLVVFLHGTFADNDTWASFPLWHNSANEMSNFQPSSTTLPFAADRISFNWIWNSTGSVVDNAQTILPQLVRAVRDWREATGAAATQADVVTHSFGGFIARQVVQTQPDPNPLTSASLANFRSATNWGRGSIHKLITLAATHRGAASANATAFLNQNGRVTGAGRLGGCAAGAYIDQGAIRDQMVLSTALNALEQTRVPGHAVVGSGRAALDPSGVYLDANEAAAAVDTSTGPYATAYGDPNCPDDAIANYTFNLDKNVPPFTGSGPTCTVTPNYDLVVSAYSSQGLMPSGATTLPTDLEKASGLSLIGKLNHSALLGPAYGSAAIVGAVSDRIVFLLQQPTTSSFFSEFPDVASVAPTAVEQQLGKFDPAWLLAGDSCSTSPIYFSGCTAVYSQIKIIPERLALEDATPAPLFVYGLLNGRWVLAYSPTVLPATPPTPDRNCSLTFTSSASSVVGFVTNTITGATVPTAKGVGAATISVTVQGFTGTIPSVPVTVTGVGN